MAECRKPRACRVRLCPRFWPKEPGHPQNPPTDGSGTISSPRERFRARRRASAPLPAHSGNRTGCNGSVPKAQKKRPAQARSTPGRRESSKSKFVVPFSLFRREIALIFPAPFAPGLPQGSQKILLDVRKFFSGDGQPRDQDHIHRPIKIALVKPESFPQQPPCAAPRDGIADLLAGDDADPAFDPLASPPEIGDQASAHQPFPLRPSPRKIALTL